MAKVTGGPALVGIAGKNPIPLKIMGDFRAVTPKEGVIPLTVQGDTYENVKGENENVVRSCALLVTKTDTSAGLLAEVNAKTGGVRTSS